MAIAQMYIFDTDTSTWIPWDGAGGGGGGGGDVNVTGGTLDAVTSITNPVVLGAGAANIGAVALQAGQTVGLAAGAANIGAVALQAGQTVGLAAGAANIGAVAIQAAQTLATVTDVTNPVGLKGILTTGPNVFENFRVASAANMGGGNAASAGGALMTNRPGDWVEFNDPGAATVATCTRLAPGAGKTLVITGISACVYTPNAQTGLTLRLINGNSGGTVIASWKFPIRAAGQGGDLSLTGLNIVLPTTNGPATLEFSAAPAAGNFESVVMTGYTLAN